MEVKRFLGFTDGIKEPQRTRTEKVLSKYYSYNGGIYNTVTYLCMKLTEGCTPGKKGKLPVLQEERGVKQA